MKASRPVPDEGEIHGSEETEEKGDFSPDYPMVTGGDEGARLLRRTSLCSSPQLLLLLLLTSTSPRPARAIPKWTRPEGVAELTVFDGVADAHAHDTPYTETIEGYVPGEASSMSCLASPGATASAVDSPDPEPDYLRVATTPWHSGGLYFDCKEKVNYGVEMCSKSCFGPYPDFLAYPYLVFRAKYDGQTSCPPTLGLSKRWPGCGSLALELSGQYVGGGSLVPDEYRQVVIPTADLVDHDTVCENDAPWLLDDVKGLWFRTCGSTAVYDVVDVKLVDVPPALDAPAPATEVASAAPTLSPTATPVESVLFGDVSDAHAHDTPYSALLDGYVSGEADAHSCLSSPYPGVTTAIDDPDGKDHLFIKTTPWNSGGMSFDCLEKVNWQCTKACGPDGARGCGPYPDFGQFTHLAFMAKYAGESGCPPTIGLSKRWPGCGSRVIELSGAYVDFGALSADEYRQVVIPTADLVDYDATCENDVPWHLNDVKGLWFRTCGAAAEYNVTDLKLTDEPPAIATPREDVIFGAVEDAQAHDTDYASTLEDYVMGEAGAFSCLASPHAGVSTAVGSAQGDYLLVKTTPWHSGGLYFDCLEKVNWKCTKSCYGEAGYPDFASLPYLVFRAKYQEESGCTPTLGLNKRWPGCGSKVIELSGAYVDGGRLIPNEYRQVVIPIADMVDNDTVCENDAPWPLNDVKGLWFRTCGTTAEYHVADVKLTNFPPEIDAAEVPSPTAAPSHAPTESPMTSPPTSAPTASPTKPIRDYFGSFVTVVAGPTTLAVAGEGILLALTQVTVDSATGRVSRVVPLARSYDSRPWEPAAGDRAEALFRDRSFSCGANGCGIDLPPPPSHGESYRLASYEHSVSARDEVARFLETATFGVTTAELDGWDLSGGLKDQMASWIAEQMDATDATFHREYWRKRTNSRLSTPRQSVRPNHPCSPNSRWRSFTFSEKDVIYYLDWHLQISGTGPYILYLNGIPRTVVQDIVFNDAAYSGYVFNEMYNYTICGLEERVGGKLGIRLEDGTCQFTENPPVDFSGHELLPSYVLDIPDEALVHPIDDNLDSGYGYILPAELVSDDCHTIPEMVKEVSAPVFARSPDGTWLQHDPFVVLDENSADAPLTDGGGSVELSTSGVTFCSNVPRTFVNEDQCRLASKEAACGSVSEQGMDGNDYAEVNGAGTVLCGSPGEVANNSTMGSIFAFASQRDPSFHRGRNKQYVWTMIALSAKDQLRQRVAWALSQIFVLAKPSVGGWEYSSESYLNYYDFFVRQAFGNFRDILKLVSYSPIMAENLSYLRSRSAAYMLDRYSQDTFADENYAREIMQLFSVGLVQLNDDGTRKLDGQGEPIPMYSNDEIMSFARAWTGFNRHPQRGNVEEVSWTDNRIDPMRIEARWRDKFPKHDLNRGYIGDGYPLCADLPPRMFLRKGAQYKLLGKSTIPELIRDPPQYIEFSSNIVRFEPEAGSSLLEVLCNEDADQLCQHLPSVTLDSNIICHSEECNVDTVRVVKIKEVYYEYVQPPCVQMAFYQDAKKVMGRYSNTAAACANPLLPVASEACCLPGFNSAERNSVYDGERVTYGTAENRCSAVSRESCDYSSVSTDWYKAGTYWTTGQCSIRIRVKAGGSVAIVYEPNQYESMMMHVSNETKNYFKVYWEGEHPSVDNGCASGACQTLPDGECLCDSSVLQSQAFDIAPTNIEDALSRLYIGAYDPSVYGNGAYSSSTDTATGITTHFDTPNSTMSLGTIFEFTDSVGRKHLLKNLHETVHIAPGFSFRNAPHFMNMLTDEENARDAQYETEAVLDHLFYQKNTAPFVSIRLIQRLVTSNPSPMFINEVVQVFRSGIYQYGAEEFGSGRYGDLAAVVASILLHPEARSVALDADASHGYLREPILKVLALMRSMEFQSLSDEPVIRLLGMDEKIGQMSHASPTVFSFFLPEYRPQGSLDYAGLSSPESMLLDMPKVVGLLNGMFSMIKTGLSPCYNGFTTGDGGGCLEGTYSRATGILQFSGSQSEATSRNLQSSDQVVDEIATLLTAGRLSAENRQLIKDAFNAASSQDSGLRIAQQLIVSSPEFHSSNPTHFSGQKRPSVSSPQPSGKPYKAVVLLNFAGGCDSFNMLVPHTCAAKDMYAEYVSIRKEVALSKANLLPIAANGNQICEVFGLHQDLAAVSQMYNETDLLFIANTGVMTQPVNKENYSRKTVTELFAHNHMTRESMRIDPLEHYIGTGILGRMSDVLTRNGHNVGSFSIDMASISLIGEPRVSPTANTINRNGVSKFNEAPSTPDMLEHIAAINEASTADSGFFAETWSDNLVRSLADNNLLHSTLSGATTVNHFPNTELGKKLEMVSKIISTRQQRGVDTDMFFVELGGFDTHADTNTRLSKLFTEANGAIAAFAAELKAADLWESVTTIQSSEFARTLTPNGGEGTDHAWGGHYMMFGGSVKGGQIKGAYPENLTDEGPLGIGRGRFIPTTPFDAHFQAIAQWVGVPTESLDEICPNSNQFSASELFVQDDLFGTPGAQVRARKRHLRKE